MNGTTINTTGALNNLGNALTYFTVAGSANADTITINAQNNLGASVTGADKITPADGIDIITLDGRGADVIYYSALSNLGTGITNTTCDRINGFVSGTSKIDLVAIDADTTIANDQAFAWVTTFTTTRGQVRWDNTNKLLLIKTSNTTTPDRCLYLPGVSLVTTDINK